MFLLRMFMCNPAHKSSKPLDIGCVWQWWIPSWKSPSEMYFCLFCLSWLLLFPLSLWPQRKEQTTGLLHTVYYFVTSAMPLFVYILCKLNSHIVFVFPSQVFPYFWSWSPSLSLFCLRFDTVSEVIFRRMLCNGLIMRESISPGWQSCLQGSVPSAGIEPWVRGSRRARTRAVLTHFP